MGLLREISVVAMRDARRLARRPSTTVVRVGISAAGLGSVLLLWQTLPSGLEEAQLGRAGRDLFELWEALVLGSTWVLAPLAVALGVQEEREAGTLDMLALSGLGPHGLFAGVAVARTAALGLIVLGSVPVLGLALGLGGFGVDEILRTGFHAGTGMVLLSAVAGVFALVGRHPLVPAIATWTWAFVSYGLVHAVTSSLLGFRMRHTAGFNPFLAALDDQWGLQGGLLAAVTVLGVGVLGGAVLDISLSQDDDEDFGQLSPSRWALERAHRLAWFGLFASAFAVFVAFLLRLDDWLNSDVWRILGTSILSGIQTSVSGILLLWGIDRVHGLGRRNATRTAEALRRGLLEDTNVGRAPVYWRDRQFGGPSARMLGGLSMVGLALLTAVTLPSGAKATHEVLPTAGMLAAIATGVLPGVACAIEEVRGGSWTLLATTRISPVRMVLEKLGATARASLPVLVVTLVAWAAVRTQVTPRAYEWGACGPVSDDPGDLLRIAVTGVWVALQPLWMSALALGLAKRAGPRWVWPGLGLFGALWFVAADQITPWAPGWRALVLPFADGAWHCDPRGFPAVLAYSTALYLALAAAFVLGAAHGFRRSAH
ncbi:MAG: hypothetical protein R3F61_27245 [Myxococcota bacterium]